MRKITLEILSFIFCFQGLQCKGSIKTMFRYIKNRGSKVTLILVGALILLGQVRFCEEEDLSKKQVWAEYDAMKGYVALSFDVFKDELKEADTTRRLNVFEDLYGGHNIDPKPEYLNDIAANGEDSIKLFLEEYRSTINTFTEDSQGVYICAVRRLVGHRGNIVDSALSGRAYYDLDTTVHNETMIAIAVATIIDSSNKYEITPSNNIEFTVAHELGHSFNLEHCTAAGCIMRTQVPWNTYYTDFCLSCRDKLKVSRP
ncbi:MAG: hypothetical protein ACPL28_11055 [bacterium]